jgi:hypothetical protein
MQNVRVLCNYSLSICPNQLYLHFEVRVVECISFSKFIVELHAAFVFQNY